MALVMKQNDTYPSVKMTVYDPEGNVLPIPDGTIVLFNMGRTLRSGATLRGSGRIADGLAGIVEYEWKPGDTSTPGGFLAEFELTLPNGGVLTVPNDTWLEVEIVPELG